MPPTLRLQQPSCAQSPKSEAAVEVLTTGPAPSAVPPEAASRQPRAHVVPDAGTSPQARADPNEMERFAKIMMAALTRAMRTAPTAESTAKYWIPDSFDDTDPYKLRNFLTQCEIYFRANPTKFRSDEKKVMFAFSYLTKNMLEWFEQKFEVIKSARPQFGFLASGDGNDDYDKLFHTAAPSRRRPNPNEWATNWDAFVTKIKMYFGPADDEAEAKRRLTSLNMNSDERINWYNLRFNRYAICTGWDNQALCYRYYEGFSDRLKDAITSEGKLKTFEKMRTLAIKRDQRYWERQGERKKSDLRPQKSESSSHQLSASAQSSSSGSCFSNQKKSDNSKAKASSASSSLAPNFLDEKLGKDGKLTEAERTRRMENNLCLFCGIAGHHAKDCKKAMKAQAASAPAETPDAKEDSEKA
jgi:hypothetical protein